MNSIGIIGQGFVGMAMREGFRRRMRVVTFDKKLPNLVHTWCANDLSISHTWQPLDEMNGVDGPIFLCLPTPMREDGSCDVSIVEQVVEGLNKGKPHTLVIKSTVPPGTTKSLYMRYPVMQFVFNPEFLTEAHAEQDFLDQDRIVLGGEREAVDEVEEAYRMAFPLVPVVKMTSGEAELVKYVTNAFLAAKVSFANEIKQIADALGISYSNVSSAAMLDKRLGTSHWQVPGPDGKRGYGGSCFPKDVNSLIKIAEKAGVDPRVIKAAWLKNLEVRPERDWELLKGRAVVSSPKG